MDEATFAIFELFFGIFVFLILVAIGMFVAKRIEKSENRYFNLKEFLPEDEIFTLKQLFYLIVMAACFINIVYSFTITMENDYFYFSLFDVAMSVLIAVMLDKSSTKNKILLLLLVPYGSLNFIFFEAPVIYYLDLIHVPVFVYFSIFYYDKFNEYTNSQGLGITILLLFVIIFVSFFATQVTEHVNPLDSLTMVSNAFTSNGYVILGNSIVGKINSIFIVWGGYIISSAATATLTAALLIKHFNRRFRKLERLIEEEDD